MRHILLTLFALLAFLPVAAEGTPDVFARYECARENIHVGDSVVVNLVLYSSLPFKEAKCTSKSKKIKGGESRLVERQGKRQQQRVRTAFGIYYAILWDSYVVGSERVEDIKFPELQFSCEVEVYEQEQSYSPFDPFGLFGRPQVKSHVESCRCIAPSYVLPIVERPKRSTHEALSSGGRVA